MRKIKIGCKITYKPCGEMILRTAAVAGIHITRDNEEMDGRAVQSCDLDKHSSVVICLDDGRWCR